jgi:hypothetical protein
MDATVCPQPAFTLQSSTTTARPIRIEHTTAADNSWPIRIEHTTGSDNSWPIRIEHTTTRDNSWPIRIVVNSDNTYFRKEYL